MKLFINVGVSVFMLTSSAEVFACVYRASITASFISKFAGASNVSFFLTVALSTNPANALRSFAVSFSPRTRLLSTMPKFASVLFSAVTELTSAPKLSSVIRSSEPASAS